MLDPVFLQGSKGRLFCLVQRPSESSEGGGFPHHAVLCVPAFAEEMNKSRRMFALLGQQLAERGVACLMPDLFGTGDSEGDFSGADWQGWIADLQTCVAWLQAQGVTQWTLLGLRAGTLLAMQALEGFSLPPAQIVLWQPAVKGKLLLTQFLRIRLASGMSGVEQAEKETTSSLRAQFADGHSVEVAGYELSAGLAQGLDAATLEDIKPDPSIPLHWLELVSGESITPVSQKRIDDWQQQGDLVSVHALSGDPFWATSEIAQAPELISTTLAIVGTDQGQNS